MMANQKLLIIGFVFPEPDSSAAGSRMLQLISLFQNQGFAVTFVSTAQDSIFMADLHNLGIEKKAIQLNHSSFDAFIKTHGPAVVLFDRFMTEEQFGWRVAENCPHALRILDTEDLHCLRKAREKAVKERKEFKTTDLLLEELAKREVASILRCDLSLMISEFEMHLLQTIFKIDGALLHYLPLLSETITEEQLQKLPAFEQRRNFVFIGNFLHNPNLDAVLYLKKELWPLIRKQLPEAILEIYGAYSSQKIMQLHQPKEGFYSCGRATSAQEVLSKARILLAPLRFGAGIKGKLLDAMQCGTPSITTFVGAEAMQGDLLWSGFVTDAPHNFADQAVRLYENQALWQEAQKRGITLIKKRFLKLLFEKEFQKRIQNLQHNLATHRKVNFMGALLHHHSLQSSKYLSRWIEEKNKL